MTMLNVMNAMKKALVVKINVENKGRDRIILKENGKIENE